MKRLLALAPLLIFTGCPDTCDYENAPAPGTNASLESFVCGSGFPVCKTAHYCPTFDSSLSEETKQLAADAMLDWEVSLRGAVAFDSAAGCKPFEIKMRPDSWFDEQKLWGARGYTSGSEVSLNSDRSCGTKAMNFILRHEFGHVLGLSHSNDYQSAMYDTYMMEHPLRGVTTADAVQYFTSHRCCPDKMEVLSE